MQATTPGGRGLSSKRHIADIALKRKIAEIHKASFSIYGSPRIHAELAQACGIRVSKKRVARLMRELKLEGVSRRGKRKVKKAVLRDAGRS